MFKQRIYKGRRLYYTENRYGANVTNRGNCLVTIDDETLLPSVNTIPRTGEFQFFEWGNRTSLSRNLAESILTDFVQYVSDDLSYPVQIPDELIHAFLNEVIVKLPFDLWEVPEFQISDFIYSFSNNETMNDEEDSDRIDPEAVSLMEAFLETVNA